MKYLKKFDSTKQIVYYDFYADMIDDHKDIDYFLNIINTKDVHINTMETLFYWSCRKFQTLAIKLADLLKTPFLIKSVSIKGIVQLDYVNFKTIIEKNELYKYIIKNNEFIKDIFYYGNVDIVKKLKLINSLGAVFNQNILRSVCYTDKVDVVKYFVSQGLDPRDMSSTNYSDSPENCLDIATKFSKSVDIIKYLVEDLKIAVTYRHMRNVIYNNNLKTTFYNALTILSNGIITDDYSYSRYATHDENKYQYKLSSLIKILAINGIDDFLKKILKNDAYSHIQDLPEIKNFNVTTWTHGEEHLDPKYLKIAYWIIDNWNGNNENSYSTKYITIDNEKFWLQKIKKNPSIITKIKYMSSETVNSYEYQKLILSKDEKNIKYIIGNLHPKIMTEYDHMPEVLNLLASKYNL